MNKLKYLSLIALFFLAGCSFSSVGKFNPDEGVPSFLAVGQTTKAEVLERLGEPLVYRKVAGRDTAIYNSEKGFYVFFWGTYEGKELVIRFEEGVVSEVKVEATGEGWGIMTAATTNNPGTRRSAR